MAAALKTPTVVSKKDIVFGSITGAAPKVSQYYIKCANPTAGDWFKLETAIGRTDMRIETIKAAVEDSSNDRWSIGAAQFYYDDSEDKFIMSSTKVGTAYIILDMLEE